MQSSEAPPGRIFLAVAIVHAALLSAGFLILADQFDFPDILRASAVARLSLFAQNQDLIVPAYYLMGLSGLTQIALAVLAHRMAPQTSTLLLAALVAGILGGAFQAMGFWRWPIAIPYLAEQMAAARTEEARAVVTLLEGLLNRYAGMVVGEHLGFWGQGLWTILLSAAMLGGRLGARTLGLAGLPLGALILVGAAEQLGGPFEAIGQFSTPTTAAWLGWIIVLGATLARTGADGAGPRFGVLSLLALISLMGAFLATALM